MKKDWVEEVGEKQMAAVFHTVMIVSVKQVGFLYFFPSVNVNLGVYLGYSMEVVYRVVQGVVRRVVWGMEVNG